MLFTASKVVLESVEVVICERFVDIKAYILSRTDTGRPDCTLYLQECGNRTAHRVFKVRQCCKRLLHHGHIAVMETAILRSDVSVKFKVIVKLCFRDVIEGCYVCCWTTHSYSNKKYESSLSGRDLSNRSPVAGSAATGCDR
jgi:hypothetical protein